MAKELNQLKSCVKMERPLDIKWLDIGENKVETAIGNVMMWHRVFEGMIYGPLLVGIIYYLY